MRSYPFQLGAAILAAWSAACVGDATGPAPRLALSPADRAISLREDSLAPVADSALVVIAGADATTASWVVSHDSASWLHVVTAGGTGNGWVRWQVDTAAVVFDTLPSVFSDTLTVRLLTPDSTRAQLGVSLTVRPGPPQYLAVRRGWRPGERDSLVAFVLAARAWGEYSDVAAQAIPAWDSTTEIVVNPAWRPRPAPASGAPRAALFQSGWGAVGLQIRVVFDSVPNDTTTRDSLQWMQTLWWDPSDPTWHGFIVNAPDTLLNGFRTVKTTTFDASYGHNGLAAGEVRLASGTYWEGSGGGWKVPLNSYSGAWTQIASGGYLGGDVQLTGQMAGNMQNIKMPRVMGIDTPKTQNFSFDYTLSPINSTRIRCYLAPIVPPAGFHQCTGSAAAAVAAAARGGRLGPLLAAGLDPSALAVPPAVRRARPRRRTRAGRLVRFLLVGG